MGDGLCGQDDDGQGHQSHGAAQCAGQDLTSAHAAGGALVVLAADRSGPASGSELRDNLVSLLAPLAIACALSLLLMVQSRRAQAARQAK